MGAFKGVNQDFRSHRRNDRFSNFPTNVRLVFASYLSPSRIGKHAEIGIRRTRLTASRITGCITIARFASTTRIIGIGKEGGSIAIPNHGRQLVILTAVRRFRTKGHLVTVRRKVTHRRVDFCGITEQVTRNSRSPQPFLVRVHHEVPKTVCILLWIRCLNQTLFTRVFRRLVHLMNFPILASNQEVSIGMVHNTVSTDKSVVHRTKSLLVRRFHKQVARTIVLVADTLHAVIFLVLGIVQGRLCRSMRHNIAHLLNPDTRRRVFGRRQRNRRLSRSTCGHREQHCR